MTTIQIHMTMAALGVAVCLAFLALVRYRHYPAFKRTLLGFVIGALVALSPFIASLGGYVTEGLLPKSLVLSFAIVLSGLLFYTCLLYTSPSPRDLSTSRMPSSA